MQRASTQEQQYFLEHVCNPREHCAVEGPLTETTLKTINKHVVADDNDGNALNAFILATGGAHTQVLLKPVSTTTNEKLLLTDIFPNGAVSLRVMNMPFTLTKCSTDWRLYISSDKAPAPRNMAIWTLFGREWFGNILVMKYRANDPTTLESVDAKDQELALHILASWFYEFSQMREHRPQYKIAGSRSWRSAGFNILFAQAEVMPFFSKTVEAKIVAT